MLPPPPRSTLFPYTTLFRSWLWQQDLGARFPIKRFQAARGAFRRRERGVLPAVHHRDRRKDWRSRFRETVLSEIGRSEEHTSELQSQFHLVCRLLLEKKKNI